jgi:DNA-directed RNA polymerase specialized sigma24 family protein
METKPKFDDYIAVIDQEINKRKNKWTLTSLQWLDFQDVAQIIRIHIFKKWNQYDSSKPIQPWLNRIITNQTRNIIRNSYSNFVRPCLKCAASQPDNGCSIYGEQCEKCPLYKDWEKKKKNAYNIKITVPMATHEHEVKEAWDDNINIEHCAERLHQKMKAALKPLEWKVYEALFINNEDEKKVAEKLGYTTNEKNRHPGYKQIKNIRKNIIEKAKKIISEGQIDII